MGPFCYTRQRVTKRAPNVRARKNKRGTNFYAYGQHVGRLLAGRECMQLPPMSDKNPPALTDDLLRGAEQIAAHLGWTERQVRYHETALPILRVNNLLIARKSELDAHFSAGRKAQ